MKYYLLNKQEICENIENNPMLLKTNNGLMSKVKKIKKLEKQLEQLNKKVMSELTELNKLPKDVLLDVINGKYPLDTITSSEYNSMYVIPLYDEQLQRIKAYNKTTIMKGKLYGTQIVLDK